MSGGLDMIDGDCALTMGLALASFLAGCHRAETAAPVASEQPRVHVETDASSQAIEATSPAPIVTVDDLRGAALQDFVGRTDELGVVFLDIYDDDSEELKPIEARRLCGPKLDEYRKQWAGNLGGRFERGPVECEAERCWHEALEAGDHRGRYQFEDGMLRGVAWTSGPPGHIMQSYLDAEERFVEEAFAALRDQPCGSVHAGEIRVSDDS